MKIAKIAFLLLVSFIVNFLEFGFIYDTVLKIIYACFLIVLILFVTLNKRIRFISLIIALLMVGLMALFFTLKQVETSNTIGSIGFLILLISLTAYLPSMILRGYIDKFQ